MWQPIVRLWQRKWVHFYAGRDLVYGPTYYTFWLVLLPDRNVPIGSLIAGYHFELRFRLPRLTAWAGRIVPLPTPPEQPQQAHEGE